MPLSNGIPQKDDSKPPLLNGIKQINDTSVSFIFKTIIANQIDITIISYFKKQSLKVSTTSGHHFREILWTTKRLNHLIESGYIHSKGSNLLVEYKKAAKRLKKKMNKHIVISDRTFDTAVEMVFWGWLKIIRKKQ